MDINLLDISVYQRADGKEVNFDLLKEDPHQFKGIWVKSSESSDVLFYPVEIAELQMSEANRVGLVANPYHFYYYHVPWDDNGDGTIEYHIIDPKAQAQCFYDSTRNMKFLHPLTDIEDPFVGPFLVWTDTASANKAISFARKVNLHLKTYHLEIYRLFGVRPDIYTGAWWLDKITKLLINNGYSYELDWMKDFNFYLADYNEGDGMAVPAGIDISQVIAWQYTSTPVTAIKGILTGIIGIGRNVDLARWMSTDQRFINWSHGDINIDWSPDPKPIPEPEITAETLAVFAMDVDAFLRSKGYNGRGPNGVAKVNIPIVFGNKP